MAGYFSLQRSCIVCAPVCFSDAPVPWRCGGEAAPNLRQRWRGRRSSSPWRSGRPRSGIADSCGSLDTKCRRRIERLPSVLSSFTSFRLQGRGIEQRQDCGVVCHCLVGTLDFASGVPRLDYERRHPIIRGQLARKRCFEGVISKKK
jgi:hypothetical protein